MGLDMYFTVRKSSYKAFHGFEAEKGVEDKTEYPENLNTFKDYILNRSFRCTETKVDYLIGYFRKFNALHGYIVEHYGNGIDECQDIYLRKEDVEEMKSVLARILRDHTKAPDLMPSCSGFFFGSTEYDSYYYKDVQDAYDLFNMILDNINFDEYYLVYQASW